jgi:hypothetical protein
MKEITMDEARAVYDANQYVYAVPCKCDFASVRRVLMYKPDWRRPVPFDRLVNNITYFQCDDEHGCSLKFYKEGN